VYRAARQQAPDDVEPCASIADVLAAESRRREVRFSGPYFVRDLLGVDVATSRCSRPRRSHDLGAPALQPIEVAVRGSTLDEIYDDEFVFRHYRELGACVRPGARRRGAVVCGALAREIRGALSPTAPLLRPSRRRRSDRRPASGSRAGEPGVDVVGISGDSPSASSSCARFGWWPAGLDLGAGQREHEGWDVRPPCGTVLRS
jgi:hypothetical protein